MTWQTIETAPKDGTRILAKMGAYHEPHGTFVVEWDDRHNGYEGGWVIKISSVTIEPEAIEFERFTHWQSLLPPPPTK